MVFSIRAGSQRNSPSNYSMFSYDMFKQCPSWNINLTTWPFCVACRNWQGTLLLKAHVTNIAIHTMHNLFFTDHTVLFFFRWSFFHWFISIGKNTKARCLPNWSPSKPVLSLLEMAVMTAWVIVPSLGHTLFSVVLSQW